MRDLLEEHAGAVEAMHDMRRHAGEPAWLRAMHVTSYEGLSIIFECLTTPPQLELADVIDRVHASPRPLTGWRPAAAPAADGARR